MEAITKHINENCLPKARSSAARPPVATIPQANEITDGQNYDNSATNEARDDQPTQSPAITTIAETIATADTTTTAAEGSKRRFGHPGVMIEYILISGVNDMPHIAHELGEALYHISDCIYNTLSLYIAQVLYYAIYTV